MEFINCYDIRSQYPSSSIRPNPVGPPLLLSTFYKKDTPKSFYKNDKVLDLKSYCQNVREFTDTDKLIVKKLPSQNRFFLSECYSFRNFMRQTIKKENKIIRVASSSHAGGQICINNFFLDGVLVLKDKNIQKIFLFNYNDSFTHGCKDDCLFNVNKDDAKALESLKTMNKIKAIAFIIERAVNKYNKKENKIQIKLIEYSNCDDLTHSVIPHEEDLLIIDPSHTSSTLSYSSYIDQILERKLSGFIGTFFYYL